MKFVQLVKEFGIKLWKFYPKTILLFLFAIALLYIYYQQKDFQPFEVYYYILFFIIYLVKFIRDYVISDRNNESINFFQTFHISFDIVIASVGAIIIHIKSLNSQNGSSILLSIVVVCILLSFFSEIIKNDIHKLIINLGIISFVLFSFHGPFKELNKSKILNSDDSKELMKSTYKVMIPYEDLSLVNNVGVKKFGNKKLIYIEEVKGIDEEEAKSIIVKNFRENVKPIYKEDDYEINFYKEEIIVIKL